MDKINISIGGKSPKVLSSESKKSFQLKNYAERMMNRKSFFTLKNEEMIQSVLVTPYDLGFNEMPDFWGLYSRIKAQYNFCPAEVAPHTCLVYPDQFEGKMINIIPEGAIFDTDSKLDVFVVNKENNKVMLESAWYRLETKLILNSFWLVCLKK